MYIRLLSKYHFVSTMCYIVLPRDQLMELEEAAEQDILRSELWTTLFRGGYMIGKLQRSLSGRYVSRSIKYQYLCNYRGLSQEDM